jgi:uncharacterized membrane protein YjdF
MHHDTWIDLSISNWLGRSRDQYEIMVQSSSMGLVGIWLLVMGQYHHLSSYCAPSRLLSASLVMDYKHQSIQSLYNRMI